MCIIIDTNCFSKVFDTQNAQHQRFQPVFKWVTSGDGRVIYGGTKYNREITGMRRFLRLLVELGRKGRLIRINDARVDSVAAKLKSVVPDAEFDDEHLVAMVAVSKCCVVCTDDTRCLPYLRDRRLYPRGVKPPNIYRLYTDARFCCGRYIAEICRPRPLARRSTEKKPKARPKVVQNYLD